MGCFSAEGVFDLLLVYIQTLAKDLNRLAHC